MYLPPSSGCACKITGNTVYKIFCARIEIHYDQHYAYIADKIVALHAKLLAFYASNVTSWVAKISVGNGLGKIPFVLHFLVYNLLINNNYSIYKLEVLDHCAI